MKTLATLVAACSITLTLAGCSGNGKPSAGPARAEVASVQVRNNNWANMNVYVERSGMRTRLGTVTSMNTETFRIPRTFLIGTGDIRLVADPIGSSNTYATPAIQVWPGQVVAFTIENHLAISSVSVWDNR